MNANGNDIGDLIRAARKKKRISARELGERLSPSVTFGAIYGWESGKTKPNADTLLQISKILDVDIKALLPGFDGNLEFAVETTSESARRDLAEFESCYARMSESQRRAVLAVASAMVESHPLPCAQDTPVDEAVEYSVVDRDAGDSSPSSL